MSVKISEMPADDAVGGSEMIPASDAGTAKRITPDQLSAYAVDQIEAIAAGSSVTGADGVFILQGGALKPVDIDTVCQHAIDTVWAKAADASPAGTDILALQDGTSTENTITLAVLAEYVRSTVQAAILDVSDLADGSGALASGNYMLVTQGTTAKQVLVSDITALIFDGLAAIVTAYDAVVTTADADVLYCLQGGVAKKIALSQIIDHYGSAIDGSGTAAYLASWTDSDTLQAGYSVVKSTAGFGAGLDTEIPTAKAVRDELSEIINDATDIGAALTDADTVLVDDGGAGTTQRKSTMARVATHALATVVDLIPTITVTGEDLGNGTGGATIQVKDAAGNNLAQIFRVRTWLSTSDFGAPVADTDFSVATGTELREIVANADYEVISNVGGTAAMTIDTVADGTYYVMAEIDGRIYSGSVAITGN